MPIVYNFNLKTDDRNALSKALDIIFDEGSERKAQSAKSFLTDVNRGIIFYWSAVKEETNPLPCALGKKEVEVIIEKYLDTIDYPRSDYTGDGDLKKGFFISNDVVGRHGGSESYALFVVKPEWIIYGK